MQPRGTTFRIKIGRISSSFPMQRYGIITMWSWLVDPENAIRYQKLFSRVAKRLSKLQDLSSWLTPSCIQLKHRAKLSCLLVRHISSHIFLYWLAVLGAIQTPQLLELSGIGNKSRLNTFGIETLIDAPFVGENFQVSLWKWNYIHYINVVIERITIRSPPVSCSRIRPL